MLKLVVKCNFLFAALIVAEDLRPLDGGLLTFYQCYHYERAPEHESKSFYFPHLTLTAPHLQVEKIHQHLTPLASFLSAQNKEYSYLDNQTVIAFNIPFSSSFSYSIPFLTVKTVANIASLKTPHQTICFLEEHGDLSNYFPN